MQVLYSPRQCEGLGLSDGEVMERLWSYLRRFSRMTKEMRPAHRLDVLSHALLYYAFTSKQKLRKRPSFICFLMYYNVYISVPAGPTVDKG